MRFKITIIIGIFSLLISSLSIANPISQKEISPQKTEQTYKKKPNFIQKIILKKIQNNIENNTEGISPLAKASFGLGIVSFPLWTFGILTALAAIITGIIVFRRKEANKKSKILSIAGIVLAVLFMLNFFVLGVIILNGGFALF